MGSLWLRPSKEIHIVGGNQANFYLQNIRPVNISPHSDFILRGWGAPTLWSLGQWWSDRGSDTQTGRYQTWHQEAVHWLFSVSWHSHCDWAGPEGGWCEHQKHSILTSLIKPRLTKYFSDAWMITGRHWVSCGVVSALTKHAIRVLDPATEAMRDIRQGGHRSESECLLYLLHSVLPDKSKSKFYPE